MAKLLATNNLRRKIKSKIYCNVRNTSYLRHRFSLNFLGAAVVHLKAAVQGTLHAWLSSLPSLHSQKFGKISNLWELRWPRGNTSLRERRWEVFLGFLPLKFIALVDGTLPRGFSDVFFFESTRRSCGLREHRSP